MIQGLSYLRGAFIAYEPDGYPDRKRVIPFRFNPEGLTRQVNIEQAQAGQGVGTGAETGGGGEAAAEQSADAASGTLKASMTVQIRLDLADRHEASKSLDPKLGIAPEVAAIEDLMYAAEGQAQASSDGTEAVEARARRPTVLFVWGRKRVFPVRITAMTINESEFNRDLNPVRAEVEVSLEVLGESDARDNRAVSSALEFTADKRRELARMFLDNTVDQGSNILPL